MPSVTIDAGLLAVPPVAVTPEDARIYVQTLLDWRILLDEPWIAVYMSERATEILFEAHIYPLRDALRGLFVAKGITEYDVNTVARVVDTLLQLTPSFEAFFKVRDVLLSNPAAVPDLLSIHTTEALVTDLARCAFLFAILRTHCVPPILDHALVVKPWEGSNLVKVRALIHDFEHSRDDIEMLPSPPAYYEGSVWVCKDFKEFIQGINELDVWNSSQDKIGMKVAIQIALLKSRIKRGINPEWDDIPSFSLGRIFFESAKVCCKANPENFAAKVVRAIVETLDDLGLGSTHALRVGASGLEAQRMRDKDKAWRRDIDHQYHLHYWKSPSNEIEFASVVVHNDFSIPD